MKINHKNLDKLIDAVAHTSQTLRRQKVYRGEVFSFNGKNRDVMSLILTKAGFKNQMGPFRETTNTEKLIHGKKTPRWLDMWPAFEYAYRKFVGPMDRLTEKKLHDCIEDLQISHDYGIKKCDRNKGVKHNVRPFLEKLQNILTSIDR